MKRRSFLQALVGVPAVVATAQLAAKLPTIQEEPIGFGLAQLKSEGRTVVYDQWPGIKKWYSAHYDSDYAKLLANNIRDLKEQIAYDILTKNQPSSFLHSP